MTKQSLEALFWEYFEARQTGTKTESAIRLRNQLVEQNIGLAREIAHRAASECPEPYEDLEQIAAIGLIRAVEKFDPSTGNAFSSFAVPYIRGEIQHHNRDHGYSVIKKPRRGIELVSRVRRVQRKLKAQGADIDESQIVRGLNITESKWRVAWDAYNLPPVSNLDESLNGEDDIGGIVKIDYSWFKSSVARIREPIQSVLIEKHISDMTEAAIAKKRKVTVEQINLWLEQGMQQLKKATGKEG
ncbi:MAG: sigma-70 family RNA polymerase sigma factor [Myxacorys californica WJT36-NPBG1]|jgi:RNA polymerase sigma-B factor|nr:sigma-70 family RNA polymerase sigma factor [Myxacorys californica WJT36-NPBG1]